MSCFRAQIQFANALLANYLFFSPMRLLVCGNNAKGFNSKSKFHKIQKSFSMNRYLLRILQCTIEILII